ncbi:MAG: hypothetical protein WC924_03970 [Candidatus Gracilibacteria bacterium]
MAQDWKYKYISLFIVLIAFVDGILVAQQFQGKGEVSLVDAVVLEDKFEQKMSSTVEPEFTDQNVPFVSQAPYGVWVDPWASFAEEACAYMSYLWANNQEAQSLEITGQALLALRDWETTNLGTYKDTDLTQTLRLLTEFYPLHAELSYDVTRENLLAQLDQGKILILPVQNLENPHYGKPGPVFHMLVVYGYEGEEFITNDPGTMRGEAYHYDIQKILEAARDLNGEVRMLVLGRAE